LYHVLAGKQANVLVYLA